jgi:hypothetical protein
MATRKLDIVKPELRNAIGAVKPVALAGWQTRKNMVLSVGSHRLDA